MANPIVSVIEQAVETFISHWINGLKPSLKLSTKSDGSVIVMSDVSTLPTSQNHNIPIRDNSHQPSKNNARYRRKLRRREARTETLDSNDYVVEMKNAVPKESESSVVSEESQYTSITPTTSDYSSMIVDCSTTLTSKKPNLSYKTLESVDIPSQIHSAAKLSVVAQPSLSIPPRTIYHPAILNAVRSMHGKHPSELNTEEIAKFKLYQQYRRRNGDPPIEEEIIYLPAGGLRTCMQCGNLT